MLKKEFYKGIKIVGLVIFIPFMLAAGPLSGYFAGDFLQKKLKLSSHIVLLSVVFGFVVGIMEVIRILKIVSRMNKK